MKRKLILLAVVMLLPGCAVKTWQAQPEFNPANVKRIGVVVPSATVKMLDVGNKTFINQELSAEARIALGQGSVDALKEGGFEVFLLTNKEDAVTFQKGYGLLAGELARHFPNNGVPTRESSIAGFDQIRINSKLDCVVAVEGIDHKSTPGRKAMLVGMALLGVSGGHGLTSIHFNAFCGEKGKPMFSEMVAKSSDLTDTSDVSDMVGDLVDHMKEVKPTI